MLIALTRKVGLDRMLFSIRTLGYFVVQVGRHVDCRVGPVLSTYIGAVGMSKEELRNADSLSKSAGRTCDIRARGNTRRYCSTRSVASFAEAFSSVFFRGAIL